MTGRPADEAGEGVREDEEPDACLGLCSIDEDGYCEGCGRSEAQIREDKLRRTSNAH